MKKSIFILLSIIVLTVVLTGCSKAKYQDGFYFAQEKSFASNGWKYMALLEVKDGRIVKAVWNGANRDGGTDKITRSATGKYGMVARGNARSEWHEQAALAERHLLKTQDPAAVKYKDAEGHTDDITGVTIHVSEFFTLVAEALKAGPAKPGPYKDGSYHAEQKAFDARTGWKSTADITVIGGHIVAANWNAVYKDGGDDKKTQAKNGQYVMSQGGITWDKQAMATEDALLEMQDPKKITYKDDQGHTDAISGVSIHVKDFFELAEEALAKAR
ncbi:MAG: FMN-binding protein [Spirochaetales bacterium]|nr:FMN-binding protein [Spirochaetales bacterium]